MNPDQYQARARKTAIYPNQGQNLAYPTLGLAGESGELLDKVAQGTDPEGTAAELGDVLWYVANLAWEAGLTLGQVEGETFPQSQASLEALDAAIRVAVRAGETAETVKKIIRDYDGQLNDTTRARLEANLAHTLQACANLAGALGTTLEREAEANAMKLESRQKRGQIHGDGDTR